MKMLSVFVIALIVLADGRTLHRAARQSEDRFWWLGGNGRTSSTTTTAAPTRSPQNIARCINSCLRTPEYNPLCGTNRETYNNIGHLMCAQSCGVDVEILFNGSCFAFA
ncbi:uncharacterized protein CBL_07395 [Carabus blaptoides fortunei]